MNARIVDNVGILKLKMLVMVNIKKKIKKNKDLKLSSGQADKREGGPTSAQASKLHAENSARFVEGAQAYEGRKPKRAR